MPFSFVDPLEGAPRNIQSADTIAGILERDQISSPPAPDIQNVGWRTYTISPEQGQGKIRPGNPPWMATHCVAQLDQKIF